MKMKGKEEEEVGEVEVEVVPCLELIPTWGRCLLRLPILRYSTLLYSMDTTTIRQYYYHNIGNKIGNRKNQ